MTPPMNRKRGSSVSFTRAKENAEGTGDEIQISLAPYIQTYLAHSGQGSGCCGVKLPIPFERAAPRSWWNPKFDSEILEGQYRRSTYPQIRLRFRYALAYILLISISWLLYFVATGADTNNTSSWPAIAGAFAAVATMASAVLYFTHTDYYRSYVLPTSLLVAFALCVASLLFVALVPPHSDGLTLVGHFALCTEILLLIYTVIPMPLYACIGICSTYSFFFEFFTAYFHSINQFGYSTANNDIISHNNLSDRRSERNFTERSDSDPRSDYLGSVINFQNYTHDGALLDSLPTLGVNSSNFISPIGTMSTNPPSLVKGLTKTISNSLSSTLNSTVISMLDNGSVISGLGDSNLQNNIDSSGSYFVSNSSDSTLNASTEASNWRIFSNLSAISMENLTLASTPMDSGTIGDITNSDMTLELIDSTIRTNLMQSSIPFHPANSSDIPFQDTIGDASTLIIRILMHSSIHLIGLHILIMTFVRMRGTFMKVGQSLLVRRQLEMEKQLKEKMIHSVMPPKVADWLMEESEREREREDSLKKGSIPSNNADIHSLFRPFNMHSMDNVSILFADIVGFTRMSSNKTAEELVAILNDLFERFDDLCAHHGCEKISTLGDCYYCVSGCPEPRPDHAKCCVDMGLAMIEAIEQFDIERREGVNMRVGVHTGTVLCGIVGTKRFKFDVWSNDVTLANKLESTGKPGRVHLSEMTMEFLGDQYVTEDGAPINGVKSYFIKGRKADLVSKFMANVSEAGNSPVQSPTPASKTQNPRHRLASCNNQSKSSRPHYLHMVTSPASYRVKANSLPSILDSDNDGDTGDEKDDLNKSPTSIASYGKKKIKQKSWRYLQRQRTTEEMTPLDKDEVGDETIPARGDRLHETTTLIREECPNGYYEQVRIDNGIEKDPMPVPTFPLIPCPDPESQAPSVCSRKDSGIRSTSRRSSIQQQLFLMNGMAQGEILGQRVSGYYTSSQSTLNSAHDQPPSVPPYPFPPAVTDTFGACFHKLRKQSDLQLIRCVQDNVSSQRSYFVKPPLSSVTLFFKNKEMEQEYRETAHKASEGIGDNPPTLATSRFNTYFDILISALVFTSVTISLFLLYQPTIYYLVFSVFATLVQLFAVYLCVRHLFNPNTTHTTFTQRMFKFFSKWHPWHVCGAVLVSLPVISILINFTRSTIHARLDHIEYYYSYLMFVGVVHYCNFTQLNCWMKNLLVTLTGILFIGLVAVQVSTRDNHTVNPLYRVETKIIPDLSATNVDFGPDNSSSYIKPPADRIVSVTDSVKMETHAANATTYGNHESQVDPGLRSNGLRVTGASRVTGEHVTAFPRLGVYDERLYTSEIFLDMALLLLLVWFLNREFEISYRLSFHGNAVAARDKARVQSMKNQADWLLHNIIPKYVADQLKTTAKYSQNHKSVGIIFASIVNFNELYDESYLGGKEYLRVLNELIGDFDELLEKSEFSNVEKIKTIGSTFMAASGLNPQVRQRNEHEYTHLFQLLEFAVAMHKVIYDFNRDLLGFKLILRIGYNYGDVTAGVIGATKLYYDIWGDAVNIASRMDSTGVAGRIQLASNCLDVLANRYEFEPRGQVFVKGKDNMDVFLLKMEGAESES